MTKLKKNKMNNKTITIIILAILLALTINYIIIDNYGDKKLQEGRNEGYKQTILQIINQAVTCQQVPLQVGNHTINLIAVDCLGNTK